eukprot:TRINITY_DN5318_c0_g1_i1.p1 TRINITY_DN5318_c0_g1~~TRINITY_DN5318_c0_g1_i1.p1  ORF type:complete len:416 (-),score=47.99 TRINITY_DN5318_c0_g1_i1:131-1378(-)
MRIAPVVKVLEDKYLTTRCNSCFNLVDSSKKVCSDCKRAIFCDECSLSPNFTSIHKTECLILKQLFSNPNFIISDSRDIRLLIRLALLKKGEITEHQVNGVPVVQDTLSSAMALSTHPSKIDKLQIQSFQMAAYNTLKLLGDNPEKMPQFVSDLVTLQSGFLSNAHEISSVLYPSDLWGIGLFPTGAIFNHCCEPNAAFSVDRYGALCFHSLRVIKAGNEALAQYIDVFPPKQERQHQLKQTYFFDCKCTRCSSPHGDGNLLSFIGKNMEECLKIEDEGYRIYDSAQDCEDNQKAINEIERGIKMITGTLHPHNFLFACFYRLIIGLAIKENDWKRCTKYIPLLLEVYYGLFGEGEKSMVIGAEIGRRLFQLWQAWKKLGDVENANKTAIEATKVLKIVLGPDHYLLSIFRLQIE